MITQPRMQAEALTEQNVPRSRPDDKFFRSAVGPAVTNAETSPLVLETDYNGAIQVLLSDGDLAQINLRL